MYGPPGEGQAAHEVTLRKKGAELEILWREENLPDDSVASLVHRYLLRWEPGQGWLFQQCDTEVARCWRGQLRDGTCP